MDGSIQGATKLDGVILLKQRRPVITRSVYAIRAKKSADNAVGA